MPSSPQSPTGIPVSNNPHPITQQLAALQATKQQKVTSSPAIPPSSVPPKEARFAWTGFEGKTVWDWLDFLVKLLGALAIPLVVVLASNALTTQQQQSFDAQHKNELVIADDQQKETVLTTYLDDMTSLLLNNDLNASKPTDEVRNVARIKTLTTLRRLDSSRKGIVLRFLHEAHLIDRSKTIIDLSGADLSYADLSYANLSYANLSYADLNFANLNFANLDGTDLDAAEIEAADLSHTSLINANLRGTVLSYANLNYTNLSGADLSYANLIYTNLRGIVLIYTNLSGADLTKAKVTNMQLAAAFSLRGTILPNGSKHP